MINSTGSGNEGDQRAGRPPEPRVDVDAGRERQQAGGNAGAEPVDRSRSMALEGEDVLAGAEDRLDPLANRRQMRAASRLVGSCRPKEPRSELGAEALELRSRVAFVGDDGLATCKRRGEQL